MAYITQEQKKEIAALLKPVMPKGWKYSLAIRNHSTIVLTISSAPIDLIRIFKPDSENTYLPLNPYWVTRDLEDNPDLKAIFEKILACLNTNNYDNSDTQTDYFDVGHYVDINLGKWNKPFLVK